jgi:hypothetical protein
MKSLTRAALLAAVLAAPVLVTGCGGSAPTAPANTPPPPANDKGPASAAPPAPAK